MFKKDKLYSYKLGLFKKRNLKRNAEIQLDSLHKLIPLKLSEKRYKFLKSLLYLREKINFFLFKKLNISQIEFTLTTKCTLKCKNCTNYIPRLENSEHRVMNFSDFKTQFDNLIKYGKIHKIYNLLLLGGEPLLVKDLSKILDYAAKSRNVEKVWIVTNGTIIFPEDLINTLKKYRKKAIVWLSNYSENEELKSIIKDNQIIEQFKNNNVTYYYNQTFKWFHVSEDIKDSKRSREENKQYFFKCLDTCLSVFCLSVFDGDLFVCPRAGVFYLKNLYQFEDGEHISLKNKDKHLKDKLIEYYSRDVYSACKFCTIVEDNSLPRITPALQIKN